MWSTCYVHLPPGTGVTTNDQSRAVEREGGGEREVLVGEQELSEELCLQELYGKGERVVPALAELWRCLEAPGSHQQSGEELTCICGAVDVVAIAPVMQEEKEHRRGWQLSTSAGDEGLGRKKSQL